MGYTDASFEDNTTVSELDGAQLYDASARRERPVKKQPEKKKKTVAEPVEDAVFLEANEVIDVEDVLEADDMIEAEEVRPTPKKAPARPVKQVRPRESGPQQRAVVKAAPRAAVKVEKAPREPITFKSMRRGLVSIMSTRSNVRVQTVKNEKRKPLPISAFAMAFICTLLLMFMIVSYVQINEYTVAVSELRSDLGDMVDRDKELTLELEKKNDMLAIEQKAGELGMVKVDQLTKKHVAIAQEDKIEVIEPEPTYDATVVTTIMSSIWENFAGLREYLG
ncbi:MAG: hypothetical protein IJR90_03995 [Clostridia bacterium]|nr:hypothetical protein [Clostridia bacterium]